MLRTCNLLLISYVRYTKHVRFYVSLPISVTVSIFTVSTLIHLTLTANIPNLLTAFPQHIIINSPIHCTGYTAYLKNLHNHFWWNVLLCWYDPHWLNNTFIFLGLRTYLNPCRRYTVFSALGVSSVQNFKYMCSGFLCCVFGLVSLGFMTFLWFLRCGLVEVLLLSLFSWFLMFQ